MVKPPVIIIGMHRSGTSLLSRVLEACGIFMGNKKDRNNEAVFFLKFNEWIFKQANATWDNPYNYTLAKEDFKNLMANLANRYIKSIRRMEYLGISRTIRFKSLKDLDFPWGWKDPRNSFTIDIWLKLFPNAKIIHIYRNPIDVAESLRRRALRCKKAFRWSLRNEIKLLLTKGYVGYGNSIRVENIWEGIKLWKEYISRIFEVEIKYNLDIVHIRYEDFLERPVENTRKILDKIGLDSPEDKIKLATKNVNSDRKYAFLSDEKLVDIYRNIKEDNLLRKLNYNSLVD